MDSIAVIFLILLLFVFVIFIFGMMACQRCGFHNSFVPFGMGQRHKSINKHILRPRSIPIVIEPKHKPVKLSREEEYKINNISHVDTLEGCEIRKLKIERKNGGVIYAIHVINPNKEGTILYSHGVGNMNMAMARMYSLGDLSSFIMFDYRGYGKTPGNASKKNMREDVRTVWDYLLDNGVCPKHITLYGSGVGTDPTVRLARELPKKEKPRGIIVDSLELYETEDGLSVCDDEYNIAKYIVGNIPVVTLSGDSKIFTDIRSYNKGILKCKLLSHNCKYPDNLFQIVWKYHGGH